ncbi:IS5 family transposase [Escherichia coli]|uniref:IS5 family transposase n=1 Tax=Escherichia coli TaxID=562 RepID=UPI0031F49D04
MSHQLTFADSEFSSKRRQTRKEIFLSRMEQILPWQNMVEVIEPFYPKAGNGRRPYPLETMLRIHCMQHWYNLSDGAMEDALYEIASMRLFARLSLDSALPDRTTIMNFRHLLEQHQLARQLFKTINRWLAEAGVMMTQGTLVDATIIEAPSSTKNKEQQRDPEMHQTKKGNQWHFGMKAHIGVDAKIALTHSLVTTAANEHDLYMLGYLFHGVEQFGSGPAGDQAAPWPKLLPQVDADRVIAQLPRWVRTMKQLPRSNTMAINIEYMKSSIRARVQDSFRIIKPLLGFLFSLSKGLLKNDNQLAMLFTLANLFRVDQMIRQWERSQ